MTKFSDLEAAHSALKQEVTELRAKLDAGGGALAEQRLTAAVAELDLAREELQKARENRGDIQPIEINPEKTEGFSLAKFFLEW